MTANAVKEVRELEIVEANCLARQEGTGIVLALKAQFIDVPFNPRSTYLVEIEMDLEHDDDKRQERGQRDFAGLRRATGVLNPETTDDLLFKPFQVKIGSRTNRLGKPENRIVEYIFRRAA